MSGLNQALASLSRLLLRLLLVAAALVLVLSLLAAMAELALAWALNLRLVALRFDPHCC